MKILDMVRWGTLDDAIRLLQADPLVGLWHSIWPGKVHQLHLMHEEGQIEPNILVIALPLTVLDTLSRQGVLQETEGTGYPSGEAHMVYRWKGTTS